MPVRLRLSIICARQTSSILEEMQDNDGASGSGDPDAATTFTTLIAAIARAGGPTYQFQQINPLGGQDGGSRGATSALVSCNPARLALPSAREEMPPHLRRDL